MNLDRAIYWDFASVNYNTKNKTERPHTESTWYLSLGFSCLGYDAHKSRMAIKLVNNYLAEEAEHPLRLLLS